MADPSLYEPVEIRLPQSGNFYHNIQPMTHRRGHCENLYISEAANGYVVHLPDEYDEPPHMEQDLRSSVTSLFEMGNIAKLMEIFKRIKEGQPYDDLIPAPPDPADTAGQEQEQPTGPVNNDYIFPYWESASAFIKQYYEN